MNYYCSWEQPLKCLVPKAGGCYHLLETREGSLQGRDQVDPCRGESIEGKDLSLAFLGIPSISLVKDGLSLYVVQMRY